MGDETAVAVDVRPLLRAEGGSEDVDGLAEGAQGAAAAAAARPRRAWAWELAGAAAIVGAWLGVWFGAGLREVSREWVASCSSPVDGLLDQHLDCSQGSWTFKLWSLPLVSSVSLCLLGRQAGRLAHLVDDSWIGFPPRVRGHWMAALTCTALGIGGGVVALWAPPQGWHSEFDGPSLAQSLIGCAVVCLIGAFAFGDVSVTIELACNYLNAWQLVALVTVEADHTVAGYASPMLLGQELSWVYALWWGTGWLIVGAAAKCLHIVAWEDWTFVVFNTGLLLIKGVILMWEVGYDASMGRLIPLMTILSSVVTWVELMLHWASWRGSRYRLDKAASQQNNGGHDEDAQDAAEQDVAGFWSTYTFWWVFGTLRAANDKGKISEADLPQLPLGDHAQTLLNAFEGIWRGEKDRENISGFRLMYLLAVKIQPRTFVSSLLHGWLFLFLMLLDPILLNRLLESSPADGVAETSALTNSLVLVLLLSASMLVRVTCMEVCFFESCRVSNNMRTLLVTAVFRKSLRGTDATTHYDTGKLTNLMATDADKIGKTAWLVFFLAQWTWAFGSLPVVIYFMHGVIGNAVWVAMATILFGGLTIRKLGNLEKPAVRKLQEYRDRRSQVLKEILASITVIKLQVWEQEWRDRVDEARDLEMRQLFVLRMLQAANVFVGTLLRVAVPVSIFAWYTAVEGHTLDSTTAFTTLAWISQMQWSISVLPDIYNLFASLGPSAERLATFLNDGDGLSWLDHDIAEPMRVGQGADAGQQRQVAVHFQGSAGHARHVVLDGVNLTINRGAFVIIAGAVGSGKSTLLATLAKGLDPVTGDVMVEGTRAFVSQRPFLLNDTVRNNITFGKAFDAALYEQCLRDAVLEQDLDALQDGDRTLVGENGVQLSGGQKARIAFARALYSDADCMFLDDVLSAVDASTGQFIWENTLTKRLAEKTVVLVTHQVQYLSQQEVSDVIILTAEGKVLCGPWLEVRAQVHDNIASFVQEDDSSDVTNSDGSSKSGLDVSGSRLRQTREHVEEHLTASLVSIREVEDRLRGVLLEHGGESIDAALVERVCATLRGEHDHVEGRKEGLIAWRDFKVYLGAFGSRATVTFLAVTLVAKAVVDVLMNVWLSIWGDSESPSLSFLYYYIGIGQASAVLSSLQTVILTLCALQASRRIHASMLRALLGASMSFFDKTPSGQLLNRFLQDLANIDNYVPNCVLDQISKTLNMVTQVGLVLLFAPWVIFTLPLIFVPYFVIFGTVRCAARDSRRLEAVAHSPVYMQFSDMLRGKLCVRAFHVEQRFEAWNRELVEAMAQGRYANEAVSKWAQTLTTQNGCLLYLSCGLTSVFLVHRGSMSLGQFGLVLLYSAQLQRASMDYMMGLTNLESQFVSVERIAAFARTPNEFDKDRARVASLGSGSGATSSEEDVDKAWPEAGELQLKDVTMRYSLHRASVLNGLSMHVLPGEKVALCGRTGCGKSSAFGAICRLYPISSGSIWVDGVDLASLPLERVRRGLRVITQDSVLVDGTLRSNLCLGDREDGPLLDRDLWAALAQVEMKAHVEGLPGQLDCEIQDGGRNFSVGQRQLLCTARALLPQRGMAPRLLLCDEATANIDLRTDEKVHDVLLGLDATVVMIMHRLQHVTRFDRVIVLAPGGTVLEQGAPADLLADTRSELHALFHKAQILP
ncbi:Metal resistance protein YCF1 (ABC-type Cd(2+) transporter) (ABC-type glutathione-S-conjugate transporter) (Yeast cadmium factor 1) [Durusdinium trenchii]|uniref:Metal resistance protein YCF1 (ABC-type Cd(2+) transporter) (ABC-type glutathione-S-conjugate transporter) (Yeast cadmium factor 1) n=1 Tax=Durusdinium trenchii TaxID=1381693 RepID=A0ABP0IBM1_9DINO